MARVSGEEAVPAMSREYREKDESFGGVESPRERCVSLSEPRKTQRLRWEEGFIEEVVCFFVFSKAVISFWLKSKCSMVNKVLTREF